MYLDYIIGLLERWGRLNRPPLFGRRGGNGGGSGGTSNSRNRGGLPPYDAAMDPWLQQTAVSCPEYFSYDTCDLEIDATNGFVEGRGWYLLNTIVCVLTAWRMNGCTQSVQSIIDRICVAYPLLSVKTVSDHVQFVTSSSATAAVPVPAVEAATGRRRKDHGSSKAKANNDSAISFHYRVLNKYMGNRIADVINALILRPCRANKHPYLYYDGKNSEAEDIVPIEAKNWYVYGHEHLERVIDHVFRTCAMVTPDGSSFVVSTSTGDFCNEFCSLHVYGKKQITYNVHTQLQLRRMMRMMTPRWWWGGSDEVIVGIYVDYMYANSAYGHRNNYQYVPPSASNVSASAAAAATADINFDNTSKVVYDVIIGGKKRVLITDRLVSTKLLEDVIVNEWFVFPVVPPNSPSQQQQQQPTLVVEMVTQQAATAATQQAVAAAAAAANPTAHIASSGRRKRKHQDIVSLILNEESDVDTDYSTSSSEDEYEEGEEEDEEDDETPMDFIIRKINNAFSIAPPKITAAEATAAASSGESVWSSVCDALENLTFSYVIEDGQKACAEIKFLNAAGHVTSNSAESVSTIAVLNENVCIIATADKKTQEINKAGSLLSTSGASSATSAAAAAAATTAAKKQQQQIPSSQGNNNNNNNADAYVTVCVTTRSFKADRARLVRALQTNFFDLIWPNLAALDSVSMTKREFKVVAHLLRYGYEAFVGMVKRLKCVHVPYTIPDCDLEYVNMVLDSVAPNSIYRKRFDRNIVTTYSRRARIVWFNHVASCSPIVLVDQQNSANVYYFYKTSAPYLRTFVTYIIPNAHRELLQCSPPGCGCCEHKELIVDVGHTFLDFLTLIVMHASVMHQHKDASMEYRQRIDFVLWEGKGMETNDAFKEAFERAIFVPMSNPPKQPHTTVILDMNDPGRMLFDRRVRYSVDSLPPQHQQQEQHHVAKKKRRTIHAPSSKGGAVAQAAAAQAAAASAWWTTGNTLLGGRFKPADLVVIGEVYAKERINATSDRSNRAVVYAYVSTHNSAHVFEAVTVTYHSPGGRRYVTYRDLVNHRMGWAASMHREPTNVWTSRDVLRIVPDTSCAVVDGIDLNAVVHSVMPVPFETLAYLKMLTKERPVTLAEKACTVGLHAFVNNHYGLSLDPRRIDGLATVLSRNVVDGDIVIDVVNGDEVDSDSMSRWRKILQRVGVDNDDLLERLDVMLIQQHPSLVPPPALPAATAAEAATTMVSVE